MALTAPKLDDRDFQGLVDTAKKRIPHYCKEWTDHNVSDPGVTLIELFAWMTETLLYRLNQVPDRHYIKFMDMLGVTLQGPVPAKVPVSFWLSAAQATAVTIPAGTAVASTQTEAERSIVFTTTEELVISPPELSTVLSRVTADDGRSKRYRSQNLRRLAAGFDGFDIFSGRPHVDDALYLGFENDLSHHLLGFEMECDPASGAGIDPDLPPYTWEAATGKEEQRWQPCVVDVDTTKGLNRSGRVRIHLPRMGKYSVNKEELYWVRARVRQLGESERAEGMQPYQTSPRLRQLSVAAWGGTVSATHAQPVEEEHLGQSDGSPGQRFQLQVTPILKRQPGENLIVQVEGEEPHEWVEVGDFGDSDAHDRHFTLDSVTGEVRLGPAVRQPDGAIKLYGAVPPRRANLVFRRYRHGGGQVGNVQEGILNTLKTAIPFIARVRNREAAWGGLDAEALDGAMMRMPNLLRSRERAVTEADFEFLALQALPVAIGRVKCLQPRPLETSRVSPGRVFVLVIPRVPHPAGYLGPDQLELKRADVNALRAYLDERRLLTTRLDIRAPEYHWVMAKVQLRATPGADQDEVRNEVLTRLYRFLNPLTGGPAGKGWEFGRSLFVSDIYQCLQGTSNVQFTRGVEMYAAGPGDGPRGEPVEELEVVAHGVVASGLHEVEFV